MIACRSARAVVKGKLKIAHVGKRDDGDSAMANRMSGMQARPIIKPGGSITGLASTISNSPVSFLNQRVHGNRG